MLFPAKLTWKVLWLLTQVGLLLLPQLRRKLHSAVHLRTTRLAVHTHLLCQGKNQDSNECDTSQLVRLSFERRWLLEVLQFESQPFSFLVKYFFLSFAFRVILWVRVRARVRLAFGFGLVFAWTSTNHEYYEPPERCERVPTLKLNTLFCKLLVCLDIK